MLRSEGGSYLTWKHASVVNLVGLVTSTSKLSCLPGPSFLNLSPPNTTSHHCSLNHLLHPATWWPPAVQQSQRPVPDSLGCFECKLSPCPQDPVCRKPINQTIMIQHLQASSTHLLKKRRNSLIPFSPWGHTGYQKASVNVGDLPRDIRQWLTSEEGVLRRPVCRWHPSLTGKPPLCKGSFILLFGKQRSLHTKVTCLLKHPPPKSLPSEQFPNLK